MALLLRLGARSLLESCSSNDIKIQLSLFKAIGTIEKLEMPTTRVLIHGKMQSTSSVPAEESSDFSDKLNNPQHNIVQASHWDRSSKSLLLQRFRPGHINEKDTNSYVMV